MIEQFQAVASRILVLHEGPNPTTDFYLTSRLVQQSLPVTYLTLDELPHPEVLENAVLIVVRYMSPGWLRLLQQYRQTLCQCIWLIDDDLLDFQTLVRVSGGLGWKWFWRSWRFQRECRRLGFSLWVSTPYLAQKYQHWQPQVLPPCSPYPPQASLAPASIPIAQTPVVFYHGSISHRREQQWLYPVFAEVARRCPNVRFEVIGRAAVARYFAGIPQVQVYPPMSWPEYKTWIQQPGRTIGLAPLLDDCVNAARAPTRYYDIQASGALGLFAAGNVYGDIVCADSARNQLVSMDSPACWVDAIMDVLSSESAQ